MIKKKINNTLHRKRDKNTNVGNGCKKENNP